MTMLRAIAAAAVVCVLASVPAFAQTTGTTVRVRGARPDVELAFPTMPARDRAGWGFLLLTNMLPNQGNGTFRLHVFAEDVEGHQVLLGSRTIIAANAMATTPFGAIDTPAQGETISGTAYVNFGWVLTPHPNHMPEDGSTIRVFIDGLPLGTVSYGHFRDDIATLFPDLANSNGAIGFRVIDTTQLADGVHTISWGVTDSAGTPQGIGSRFFSVANEGLRTAGQETSESTPAPRVEAQLSTDRMPGAREVSVREMERVEIDVARQFGAASAGCTATYDGYEQLGEERRELPVGASLDRSRGRFVWQPGPGFVGRYRLVFMQRDCAGNEVAVPLTVTILRKE